MVLLRWLAARGPWVLVAGIVAGMTLPGLAQVLVPYIPEMVAGLLFLAALRIGPSRMAVALSDMRSTLAIVLVLQLLLPLVVIAGFAVTGLLSTPVALAAVIIAMAPSISGSPNIVLMMGYDPAEAMRFVVVGTALLPLTVIPVLVLIPALGELSEVIAAAFRLLVVIVAAGGLAFAVRWTVLKLPKPETLTAIDGASALLLAVIVVGLMSAVSEALHSAPWVFWGWLLFVLVVNFGLQAIGFVSTRSAASDTNAALTVISGNRNIALFLVALPEQVTAPLLVFIGCYQIPMYLTPLVTGRALKAVEARQQN